MSNNVVQFPKEKRGGGPPQNLDEVKSNLETVRHIHVEETLAMLAGVMFDNLAVAGFNFDPDNTSYTKDVALTFEAMKSMMYKYHNMEYPMQGIADEVFTLQENGTVLFNKESTLGEEI